jgi:hypothetical protein
MSPFPKLSTSTKITLGRSDSAPTELITASAHARTPKAIIFMVLKTVLQPSIMRYHCEKKPLYGDYRNFELTHY